MIWNVSFAFRLYIFLFVVSAKCSSEGVVADYVRFSCLMMCVNNVLVNDGIRMENKQPLKKLLPSQHQ